MNKRRKKKYFFFFWFLVNKRRKPENDIFISDTSFVIDIFSTFVGRLSTSFNCSWSSGIAIVDVSKFMYLTILIFLYFVVLFCAWNERAKFYTPTLYFTRFNRISIYFYLKGDFVYWRQCHCNEAELKANKQ